MKRIIEKKLAEWKIKKNRKPIIIQGARQVGKTYSIQKFAKENFRSVHYFDLEALKADLAPLFNESSLKPEYLIKQLSFFSGHSIELQHDVLILDEIQAIPRALVALKYFHQEIPELAICVAGSNLGIAMAKEPFPVGKVEIIEMFPLSFLEFLQGTDEFLATELIEGFSGGVTSDLEHKRLFELLKTYLVVGGLPGVITAYLEFKDHPIKAFEQARKEQQQLLMQYSRDFSKYSGSVNARHIERVFQAIPSQLSVMQNKKSKKFIFKDVISKGYRSYESLADPIDWLVKANLALKVSLIEIPAIPLPAYTQENAFKLFLFDIGLLGSIVGLRPIDIQRYNYGTYKGFFAENYVLQELVSQGYQNITSWSGRMAEIEFVFDVDGQIVPVEVKAGINTRAKSLQAYIQKYTPAFSVKITGNKFGYDSTRKIFNLPLYLTSKFSDLSENHHT